MAAKRRKRLKKKEALSLVRSEVVRLRRAYFRMWSEEWPSRRGGSAKGSKRRRVDLSCVRRRRVSRCVFSDVEFGRAEVDEQSMLDARGTEVTEELRHVFIEHVRNCLQFDDDCFFEEQVGKKAPQHSAVFVMNVERMLLSDPQAALLQPMHKRIFIDLLDMSIAQVAVDREPRLAHRIAQLEDIHR